MNDLNKRGWLEEEDILLKYLVESNNSERIKWVDVAKILHEKLGRARNGKQCRQRWQHQVNPNIVHQQWTSEEQEAVFSLQLQMGNKWALIAQRIPGRTDNAVKNYFYSTVRRVFTRVNLHLSSIKSQLPFKSMREFQSQFLSKLMAVVDGNFSKKIRLTSEEGPDLAKKILERVWHLTKYQQASDQELKDLIILMNNFRKICKKRKQKSAYGLSFEAENSIDNSYKSSSQSHPNSAPAQMQEQQDGLNEVCLVKGISMDQSENKTKTTIEDAFMPASQPVLFSLWSGFKDEGDKWWEVLNKNTENRLQMEEQHDWKWNSNQSLMMNLNVRHEELLGSSQTYGGSPIVTNFQMLQASIALEDLLLKAKSSSSL